MIFRGSGSNSHLCHLLFKPFLSIPLSPISKSQSSLLCPSPARVRSVRISARRRLLFLNMFSARAGHVSAHPPSPSPGTWAQEKEENGKLQQRDAERGHAQRWHQERILGHHGRVLCLQGLQAEVDKELQVDQLRGLGLSEERPAECDREPGGDHLREDRRPGQDLILGGGLRVPQLREIPEGQPGPLPEEVQRDLTDPLRGERGPRGSVHEARRQRTR